MSNMLDKDIDKKISNYLNNKAEGISASEDMFFKIRAGILKENKGAFYNMKIRFLKARTAIIAGLICIVTTATCAATTNGSFWISNNSKNGTINSFPSNDTVKSSVGFLPKYVDSFEGGFKFNSFDFSGRSLKDGSKKTVIDVKDASFDYKKDGAKKGQSLYLDTTAIDKQYFDKEIDGISDITEYNGIKIYYSSIRYKFVPEKYEKTEEDIKLFNEGLLQISYGSESEEVEECNTKTVSWYEDGIEYLINNMGYDDVSRDEMINMAKKVINK